MEDGTRWARRRAGAAALLLVLAGAALGVLVDRLWLLAPEAQATPLTVDALAQHLSLSPADQARVRVLLDSMHADMLLAMEAGPEALARAARDAHLRLEESLPADARPAFRHWMEGHHRQMMERMHGGMMHGPGRLHPRGGG